MSRRARCNTRWPQLPARTTRPNTRSVIGLDHSHIHSIADTIQRGGGELVTVNSTNPLALAGFQKRFGARVARSEDEILNDPSIQLVCSAAVPNLRGPLGVLSVETRT